MPLPFPNYLSEGIPYPSPKSDSSTSPLNTFSLCGGSSGVLFGWTIWKIHSIRWTLDNWIPKYLPIVFFSPTYRYCCCCCCFCSWSTFNIAEYNRPAASYSSHYADTEEMDPRSHCPRSNGQYGNNGGAKVRWSICYTAQPFSGTNTLRRKGLPKEWW